MTQMLKQIVEGNKFNIFCVDCQKNKSTHANITYGTFICHDCAKQHWGIFTMNQHYIKPINEMWDSHQLKVATFGGNKHLFDFLKQYEMERLPVAKKYGYPAPESYKIQFNLKV